MGTRLLLIFSLLTCLIFSPSRSSAIGNPPRKPVGYLIISNNLCIVVRAPARQISTIPGQAPLLIMLKDHQTIVTIQSGYLMMSVPLDQIDAAIRKYHFEKLNLIE